jgi:hypothetical protein
LTDSTKNEHVGVSNRKLNKKKGRGNYKQNKWGIGEYRDEYGTNDAYRWVYI